MVKTAPVTGPTPIPAQPYAGRRRFPVRFGRCREAAASPETARGRPRARRLAASTRSGLDRSRSHSCGNSASERSCPGGRSAASSPVPCPQDRRERCREVDADQRPGVRRRHDAPIDLDEVRRSGVGVEPIFGADESARSQPRKQALVQCGYVGQRHVTRHGPGPTRTSGGGRRRERQNPAISRPSHASAARLTGGAADHALHQRTLRAGAEPTWQAAADRPSPRARRRRSRTSRTPRLAQPNVGRTMTG